MWCHFGCRFASITPGQSTGPVLNKSPFKWKCLSVETSWGFIFLFAKVCCWIFHNKLAFGPRHGPYLFKTLLNINLPWLTFVSFQVFWTIFFISNYIAIVIGLSYLCRHLKKICLVAFRETCQWLKFPLNRLRAHSRVSTVVGLLLPLASGPACLEE